MYYITHSSCDFLVHIKCINRYKRLLTRSFTCILPEKAL